MTGFGRFSQLLTPCLILVVILSSSYISLSALYYISTLKAEVYELRRELNELSRTLNSNLTYYKDRLSIVENKEERIAKLVDPWERCLRFEYRKRCEESDANDPNLPPCQSEILKEMIFVMTDLLEKSSITHWISYGTLLGAVRQQKIIPWTADADVVVKQSDYNGLQHALKASNLNQYGYMFFYDKKYPDIGRMCIVSGAKYRRWEKTQPETSDYFNAYPYADLYQTQEDDFSELLMVKFGPGCRFRKDIIYPLTKVKLYDREMFAPKNYSSYLAQIYGEDWMVTPAPNRQYAHGPYNEACKNG